MKTLLRYFAATAVTMVLATGASAQLIAEWDYNDPTGAFLDASTGTGTSSGSAIPLAFALPDNSGSSADPVSVDPWDGSTTNSNALRSAPFSNSVNGDPSGLAIMQWNTSTAGRSDIAITWDMVSGFRSSRYYQISATTDGINFSPVSGGVGTGSSTPGVGSATVDSSGLITVVFDDGFAPASGEPAGSAAVDYLFDLSYALPTGSAFEFNPNFGVQIAAIHDPAGSDYVSSFAGTTEAADAVKGYTRSGSSARYDLVRVTGVPEPTSLALAVCGLAMAGVRRRR